MSFNKENMQEIKEYILNLIKDYKTHIEIGESS